MSDNLTFWSEEHLANHSALRDFGKDLMTRAGISCSHLDLLQIISDQPGLSGKTCLVSCHLTEDEILVPSSGCWANSGMGSPIGFVTLNTLEWHKDAAVCSLSDTLETGDVQHKYYMTPRACAGNLRRAEKREKELPNQLRSALEIVANQGR